MKKKKVLGTILVVLLLYFIYNISKTYYYSKNFVQSKSTNLDSLIAIDQWSAKIKSDAKYIDDSTISLLSFSNKLEVLKYNMEGRDVVILNFPFQVLEHPTFQKGKRINLQGIFTDQLDISNIDSFIPIETEYKSKFRTLVLKSDVKPEISQNVMFLFRNSEFINLEADGISIFYLTNERKTDINVEILQSAEGLALKFYFLK